ncbi:MAG: hypothetical protein J1F65_06005 [Clostridiales bacterium]|nr:hypothetical protein [Clostridiales bacterium]
MLGMLFCIIGLVLIFAGIFISAAVENFIVMFVLFICGLLFVIAGILYTNLPRKKVKKHRTPYTVEYKCSKERVQFAIDVFMKENEYEPLKYNDEDVYKKGNGWWLARRFIKCTINDDNTVLIEGWISQGMGSAASTEIALTGFYGAMLKKILIGEIEELRNRISNVED